MARTDQSGKQGKAPPSSFLIVSPRLHSSTTPVTAYDQQAQQVQQASDNKNDCGQTSYFMSVPPFPIPFPLSCDLVHTLKVLAICSSYMMKATCVKKNQNVRNAVASTSMLDTSCRIVQVTYHTNSAPPKTEEHYCGGKTRLPRLPSPAPVPDIDMNEGGAPLPFQDAPHEEPGASPAYDMNEPLEPEEAGKRRSVDSMDQFKAKQDDFLKILLSLHSSRQVNTPCSCPEKGTRTVACQDCMQSSRSGTMASTVPAEPAHSFTLVDTNSIHATAIRFCGCTTAGEDYQQLLQARIFPGSIKDPKTGYTLGLLEHYHQARNQGKGSAYNFDIYANFLMPDAPLPGELGRPYPDRAKGYLGMPCGACPERGINMPLVVTCPSYLCHLISRFCTIDANFKMNLYFKRDNGTDIALTDGDMYFPLQALFDRIKKMHVVPDKDKEVPCKSNIGSICHQASPKYGNMAVSGVVACTCDHTVAGSFINMPVGEV
ncbi:hypothetical protein B0H10DRAFT_2228015 [Mycena sp. CBHHK59/15]|nr:hypothetical protein B0H10DRAFT_2228015 [Mycena sp. CBHHK59/15]